MSYEKFVTPPAHTRAQFDDANNLMNREDPVKWGSDAPPPAIGTVVKINFNQLGLATVRGYFVEHTWLGLLVDLHAPPEWWRKQNQGPRKPLAHVFGPEFTVHADAPR